ncbi:PQQ-dependent sugar dehydrogenase, partial [Patescibacteria group bacterium]|nr:PQQ-dependent sugar dehydrogenase [Patescibacteria group bacterium]
FVSPVIQSGRNTTWAPAGTVFYNEKIYFTGLRGNGLYEYDIETGELSKYLDGVYGRLRAITVGPDGYLYVSTSNRDGRGDVRDGDDKILKINLELLK